MKATDKQPDGRLVMPLDIGSKVKPYGEIVAVAFIAGDRYYFMKDKRSTISLMPWSVVEHKAATSNTDGPK